jgi:hypothetical protein
MHVLPLFFVESQAAKRRFLKSLELPDDCRSHLEGNGGTQGRAERANGTPKRAELAHEEGNRGRFQRDCALLELLPHIFQPTEKS